MKKSMWIAAVALLGAAACGEREPETFTGHITDATMNSVTVQDLSSEQTYTFSLADADRSEAYGLLVGAPVVVEYRGRLEDGADALKVSTNPTYAEAVGRWIRYDEENPAISMGIEIRVEGEAVSINSATLLYSGWELLDEADKILLRGRSVGQGESFDFSQTGVITRDAEGRLQLTIEGTKVVFTKVSDTEKPAAENGQAAAAAADSGNTEQPDSTGSDRTDSASVAK